MGFFDSLGDMARSKYDSFKEDPYGSVSRTVSNSAQYMNRRYEEEKEKIIKTGASKARSMSDDELRRYADRADSEGNSLRQAIADREKARRGW